MTAESGMIPDAEEVANRLAIADVLNLHSRGIDRLDREAIQCAYWQDAEVDYGSYKGSAHIFADLVVGALGETYELTRHCLYNTLIEFRGNTALSETSVTAGHLLKDAEEEMLFYGRYLDTLEKRDGRWKIFYRQVVMDWSKQIPVQDQRSSTAFFDLAKGTHIDSDPLYSFLKTS
ncbi:MAG: nuclear transport factor 2 family protein [Halioglobus sp.]|nr:nuclear transport factor 2 family protein [Halioglobus sp.]